MSIARRGAPPKIATATEQPCMRLPMIPSEATKNLREADRRSMLGSKLVVVGTNAMPAYSIEAGGEINDAPAETDDFDMAWSALVKDEAGLGVIAMLKAVDSTYTVKQNVLFRFGMQKLLNLSFGRPHRGSVAWSTVTSPARCR